MGTGYGDGQVEGPDRLEELIAPSNTAAPGVGRPAMAEDSGKDPESLPAVMTMFLNRFVDLERSMEKSRREFAIQMDLLRVQARRSRWATVALVLATAALVAGVTRLTAGPPAPGAAEIRAGY